MAKRAICVGINKFAKYPQFTLNGCVNDAKDMVALCKGLLGFKATEVKLLTDAQATKAAIMAELKAAVADAKAGKISYLLFSWSSHGTQVADKSGDEPDGMDEAFVPYDIDQKGNDWDPAHIISDDELHDLFAQLPPNVLLEVYLDTCHSGSGLREAFSLTAPRPKFIAPLATPATARQAAVRGFTLQPRTTAKGKSKGAAKALAGEHHILWSGCKDNQTSADAFFSGRYNGAFTYYFCKVMNATHNKQSRKAVVAEMRKQMKGQFTQVPQLEGNATNRQSVILY